MNNTQERSESIRRVILQKTTASYLGQPGHTPYQGQSKTFFPYAAKVETIRGDPISRLLSFYLKVILGFCRRGDIQILTDLFGEDVVNL